MRFNEIQNDLVRFNEIHNDLVRLNEIQNDLVRLNEIQNDLVRFMKLTPLTLIYRDSTIEIILRLLRFHYKINTIGFHYG